MINYSAGYIKTNPNFVIQNIDECEKCDDAVFAILHNIYTRGCPTIPARMLRKEFGEPSKSDSFRYWIDFSKKNWTDKTIKGGGKTNPAYDFYQKDFSRFANVDPKYIGSFIPECPFKDAIYAYSDDPINDQHLDFYSPLYKTDIEVDGPQHKEPEQKEKDRKRDAELKMHGIDVIRIPAYFYRYYKKRNIYEEANYTQNLILPSDDISDDDTAYLFAIRIELLLLNLYMSKKISLDQPELNIYLHTYPNIGSKNAQLIVDDFYNSLSLVMKLQNRNYVRPAVKITFAKTDDELEEKNGIKVDISLNTVYTETKYDDIYYIRNDYFQYEEKRYFVKNKRTDTYSFRKNYYRIYNCQVEYSLNQENHGETLRLLLEDTSRTGDYEDGFRANQLEIIIELLNTQSVIGVLPTGAGKSLCYQLCTMLIPGMTIVVAPLQLLMMDQCNAVSNHFGITNTAIINSMSKEQIEIVNRKQSMITIVSPERFFSYGFSDLMYRLKGENKVSFLVVDEVHCLSEWGHDFRTSYLCLSNNLVNYFNSDSTFLIALTGTASYRVLEDVELELEKFRKKKIRSIFADDMKRNELNVHVIPVKDEYYTYLHMIVEKYVHEGMNDKMLIFTNSKSINNETGCKYLRDKLVEDFKDTNLGDIMSIYVGGNDLKDREKKVILDDFSKSRKRIVLATKAFGMGVDIPDIRTTVNCGIPSSIEGLYQEIGRAGRDKQPADCYILFKHEKPEILDQLYSHEFITMKDIRQVYNSLVELKTNFYFVLNDNLDPDVEVKFVKCILNSIRDFKDHPENYDPNQKGLSVREFTDAINDSDSAISSVTKRGESVMRELVEKSLYRLYLLGEIDLWKVVYDADLDNPTFTELRLTNLDDKERLEHMEEHIDRYQTGCKFEGENVFDNRLQYLVEWVNKNYLQERLQTMKTLYNACMDYQEEGKFMEFLNSYFSVDDVYMKLTGDSVNVIDCIEVLRMPVLTAKPKIARLLESYDRKPSVNYVSGVVRLMLGEFEDSDGRRRLEYALNAIKNNVSSISSEERKTLFINTYKLLDNIYKDLFVETWIKCIDEDANFIFANTENSYATEYVLNKIREEEKKG